jgi:hypothetical protein
MADALSFMADILELPRALCVVPVDFLLALTFGVWLMLPVDFLVGLRADGASSSSLDCGSGLLWEAADLRVGLDFGCSGVARGAEGGARSALSSLSRDATVFRPFVSWYEEVRRSLVADSAEFCDPN